MVHPIMAQLRELRREKKLRQIHIADAVGYNHKSLSMWETGAVSPTLLHLADYADFLGMELCLIHKKSKGKKHARTESRPDTQTDTTSGTDQSIDGSGI